MIIVLSPAKSLDYESDLPAPLQKVSRFQEPALLTQSRKLVAVLKKKTPADLSALMSISKTLAKLNHDRYQNFRTPLTDSNARPALCAFNGDVYRGFELDAYKKADFDFAQTHVRILSGLYGLLRPLDLMYPYRLEMGTRLSVGKSKDLYGFWGNTIADVLQADIEASNSKLLLNLASVEYFKSVRTERLQVPVVSPVFKEKRGSQYKIVSINAKRARGIMTNFVVRNKVKTMKKLLTFAEAGYFYNPDLSDDNSPVFTRD